MLRLFEVKVAIIKGQGTDCLEGYLVTGAIEISRCQVFGKLARTAGLAVASCVTQVSGTVH
jgi:hypothetical protein